MVVVNKEILNMIKKGISLNKISELTKIGKSTLYFHYKKLKGRKVQLINLNLNREDLGEFLGVFAGDGSFYKRASGHYVICIYIGYYEKHYAEYLKNKFLKWFGKKPKIYYTYYKNKKSMITLHYYSRSIYDLIWTYLIWEGKKSYSVRLRNFDLENLEFNCGFLRGLVDTDGSFYPPKSRLSFSTVSKELALQASSIINKLINESPKFYVYKKKGCHDLYTLSLHGKRAVDLINLIKPGNINKSMR